MNFLRQISLLVLAGCLGLGLAGCQPSDPNSPRVAQLTSIVVTPNPVNLEIGGVASLTVTGSYSDGSTHVVNFDSTFTSSAPAIARVDSGTGYVTALAEGSATITATTSGKSATTTVTVAPLRVISVTVSPATSALTVGATQALTVNATYNNTSTGDVTADSTFASSNPDAATVDAAGMVTAVAEGSATITATHTPSGESASATVTVSAAVSGDFTTITFDEPGVTYTLTGFGGAEDATLVPDPAGGSNTVARVVKSATAELWAGTTVSTGPNQSVGTIPFTATSTQMTVRVYSPRAGVPVRLKVEDAADGTRSVETEAVTTVANAWETLTFDFANPAAGTAALNLAYTYNKVSIFFDFGTTGAAGGGGTFYFDDVAFVEGGGGGGSSFTTITFDAVGVTYTLTGFGGAEDATVAADPIGGSNMAARVVKSATAELWAGTTVSTGPDFSVDTIPFTATSTQMTVRVYSPRAGVPVRLKVEDAADGTRSVETEAVTTVANAWETLTFDFSNPVAGTAALNLAYTYNKVSIFFDFGTTGAAGGGGTFYFDDVAFVEGGGGGGGGGGTFTTITFDAAGVTYTLTGFGGAEDATLAPDPVGGSNTVARVVKSATAELWAGTTVSTGPNFSVDTIPFTATATQMTVRVYSPRAGIPVRLKVEDAADGTHSVETEALTTVANSWQTLTFNFANPAAGTAALNLAYTYNKVSIFFDFGTTGAAGGGGTFYIDDVAFD